MESEVRGVAYPSLYSKILDDLEGGGTVGQETALQRSLQNGLATAFMRPEKRAHENLPVGGKQALNYRYGAFRLRKNCLNEDVDQNLRPYPCLDQPG